MALETGDQRGMRIVDGYIENDAALNRTRALAVPVRRTYLRSDPVNFDRILDVIRRTSRDVIHDRAIHLSGEFAPIREELESVSILNDRRVRHAEMFEAWIDAMVFFDAPDKLRRYHGMVRELGKAVEGIGLHLCEQIAHKLLALDELVADFLGEPRFGEGPPDDQAPVSHG